jgi:trimeric autotransporter adhesin
MQCEGNPQTTGTTTGTLTVGLLLLLGRGKPRIVVQPAGVTRKEGQTATFTVTAIDAASYQWQRSDNNGSSWNNVGTSQASHTTGTLTIVADNQDLYRVQVRNEAGSVVSSGARLSVEAGGGPE